MSACGGMQEAADNPYRATIDSLLARGRQLVQEVNTIPAEERQDVLADELNALARRIHDLLQQEQAYLQAAAGSGASS